LCRLQSLCNLPITPGTTDTIDTIISDSIKMDESDPEQMYPESPISTVGSVFYQDSSNLDFACIVNCDLAINYLTTNNTSKEIWINLNKRCIEKFGDNDYIKSNVAISDITWAYTTLPAYVSWNSIVNYHNDIKKWIAKINDFSLASARTKSQPSTSLQVSPSPLTRIESQPPATLTTLLQASLSPSAGTESRPSATSTTLSQASVSSLAEIESRPSATSTTSSQVLLSPLAETESQHPATSTISSQTSVSLSLGTESQPLVQFPSAAQQSDTSTILPAPVLASLKAKSRSPVGSKKTLQPPAVSSKAASRPLAVSSKAASRPPAAFSKAASQPLAASSKVISRSPVASSKATSQLSAASSKVTSQSPVASSKATSQLPAASSKKATSQSPVASSKATSQLPAASSKVTSRLPVASLKASSKVTFQPLPAEIKNQALAAPEAAIHKRCKLVNYTDISSDEEDYDYVDNAESMKVTKQQTLNSAQLLLFKKGQKLREILLNPQINNECSIDVYSQDLYSQSELTNIMTELSTTPIKVIDTKSAEDRVHQWKNQESQCNKFRKVAELYNLVHLMSLVQIYEDLIKIGEELKKDPKNGIKNVGVWVMNFIRSKLNINNKAEQRNRIGCTRLRRLFDEGITCTQLVQAGLRKCDFFTKKENYEIFLSQIPSLDTRNSLSSNSSNEHLSNILDIYRSEQIQLFSDNMAAAASSSQNKKKNVTFKLDLRGNFEDIADKYKDNEYIIT